MKHTDIKVKKTGDGVATILLDRTKVNNALRTQLLGELADVLKSFEPDNEVRCVVLAGEGNNFAAGADIKEMAEKSNVELLDDPRVGHWQSIAEFPKPFVAAVNGYCLGGGCELAMHADIIIAGNTARFGQPEINLGIIPGAGGTQRLIRCAGKSLAAQMILTGEMIDAKKALAAGLVSEVCEPEITLDRAITLAKKIATKAPLAARMAKESLRQAFETPLSAGLQFERRSFISLASTEDRNEGIAAFLEKRKPVYKGK